MSPKKEIKIHGDMDKEKDQEMEGWKPLETIERKELSFPRLIVQDMFFFFFLCPGH